MCYTTKHDILQQLSHGYAQKCQIYDLCSNIKYGLSNSHAKKASVNHNKYVLKRFGRINILLGYNLNLYLILYNEMQISKS